MTTPRQNIRVTADQWRKRYAEICKQYPDILKAKRFDAEGVRQWEEFVYAIDNPPPGRWRVVKVPGNAAFAFQAIFVALEACKNTEIEER
jgi:hypothetical protein